MKKARLLNGLAAAIMTALVTGQAWGHAGHDHSMVGADHVHPLIGWEHLFTMLALIAAAAIAWKYWGRD